MATFSDNMESIKTCKICGLAYEVYQMQGKYKGRYVCKHCFPLDTDDMELIPKNGQMPSHSWVNHKNMDLYETVGQNAEKMFPTPWHYSSENKKSNKPTAFSQNPLHISMKPISCPFSYCRKALGVTGIPFHFHVDHKNVDVVSTRLEATNGANLDLTTIKSDEIACIMLFNILDESNEPLIVRAPSMKCIGDANFTCVKPVLLALVTKINKNTFKGECSSSNDHHKRMKVSSKIYIWLTSNIPVDFSYTLCLSSVNSRRRLKYRGPVFSLKDKLAPPFNINQGLILTDNHINFMLNQDKSILDIMIHDNIEEDI